MFPRHQRKLIALFGVLCVSFCQGVYTGDEHNNVAPDSIPGIEEIGCCPTYWTYWNKACYRFYGASDKNWQDAESYCTLISPTTGQTAHLVSINSKAEGDVVHALYNEQGSKGWNVYWIGGTDQVNEGRYEWSDGSTFDYTNWKAGEPNSSGEDCIEVYEDNGMWNDEGCGDKHPFVCEVPAV